MSFCNVTATDSESHISAATGRQHFSACAAFGPSVACGLVLHFPAKSSWQVTVVVSPTLTPPAHRGPTLSQPAGGAVPGSRSPPTLGVRVELAPASAVATTLVALSASLPSATELAQLFWPCPSSMPAGECLFQLTSHPWPVSPSFSMAPAQKTATRDRHCSTVSPNSKSHHGGCVSFHSLTFGCGATASSSSQRGGWLG